MVWFDFCVNVTLKYDIHLENFPDPNCRAEHQRVSTRSQNTAHLASRGLCLPGHPKSHPSLTATALELAHLTSIAQGMRSLPQALQCLTAGVGWVVESPAALTGTCERQEEGKAFATCKLEPVPWQPLLPVWIGDPETTQVAPFSEGTGLKRTAHPGGGKERVLTCFHRKLQGNPNLYAVIPHR